VSFLNELKRRHVFRIAAAYLGIAWLITEVAGTVFSGFGIPDWAFRFVVIVLMLGLVPILIFTWVYEMTPEGLKREAEVVRDEASSLRTARRLDGLTIGAIGLALAFVAVDRLWLSSAAPELAELPAATVSETGPVAESEVAGPQHLPNSIAVLPFVNMSDDAGNEYFSDGVSDELLNLLAKIPELRVISRSSAFSFKGKDIDIPTIARQLDVAYIVEGSVRKSGNQVRITAQLIEARSDTHLWSETYDRELENIFAIQDEISASITDALKERLGLRVEAKTGEMTVADTEAHDAFLRGRFLVAQRTWDSIEGAIMEFEKAIALDPDYALAHAELALATLLLPTYGDLTFAESKARAAPHVERAMALDPNLAEAYAAKGYFLWGQGANEESLTAFERAIQINPSYSDAYFWKANLLFQNGRYEESHSLAETALRLDPLSIRAITSYASSLRRKNRLDDAARELEKFASMDPVKYAYSRAELKSVHGKWANLALGCLDAVRIRRPKDTDDCLPIAFALIGLEQEALTIADSVPDTNAYAMQVLGYALQVLGRPIDAVATADKYLVEDPIDPWSRRNLGLALAASGDYVRARPLLEESWQRSNGRVTLGAAGVFWVDHAAALIAIRRAAGEVSEIDELLAAIRDNVRRYREAGITTAGNPALGGVVDYEEGLADFLSGERQSGLALIAKAAEDGSFILPNEAYLQTLYDDPGFAPIRAGQEARQTRERERFLAIVCTDNPYESVWQPAEGTCERFAAK